MLRFRDLGASFSSLGCFVLRSSFSSASFSKLPSGMALFIAVHQSYQSTWIEIGFQFSGSENEDLDQNDSDDQDSSSLSKGSNSTSSADEDETDQ